MHRANLVIGFFSTCALWSQDTDNKKNQESERLSGWEREEERGREKWDSICGDGEEYRVIRVA